MLGAVGAVEVDCPPNLRSVTEEKADWTAVCARSRRSFELFQATWDAAIAGREIDRSLHPGDGALGTEALTAWKLSGGAYSRFYKLGGKYAVGVTYMENTGEVGIVYRDLP